MVIYASSSCQRFLTPLEADAATLLGSEDLRLSLRMVSFWSMEEGRSCQGEARMTQATTEHLLSLEEVTEQLATRVFNPQVYTVYTNTTQTKNRAVKGYYPHLVAVGKVSQRVEIVGLVETAETLHDQQAAMERWRTLTQLQAASYLYVPKGSCPEVRALCLQAQIPISDFRHYWFDEDGFHVQKCFP